MEHVSNETVDDYLKSSNSKITDISLVWTNKFVVNILKINDDELNSMGIIYLNQDDYIIFKDQQLNDFGTEFAKRADFLYYLINFRLQATHWKKITEKFNDQIESDGG